MSGWRPAARNSDFIEIYNPNAQPVALGGLFLTDEPIGAPALHRIDELSFVAANGFVSFTADGDDDTPSHVNFQLPSEVGEIGLFSAILQPIDCVIYGPQQIGVSMGRCPDGGFTNRFMSLPTPGSINACPVLPPAPQTISLIGYSDVWLYDQNNTDLYAINWTEAGYPDAAWPNSGPGAFANAGISGVTVNTFINNTTGTVYFRTRFVVPTNANFTSVQLAHFFDDGAVVYVNGQEAYRYNMNPGAVRSYDAGGVEQLGAAKRGAGQ